MKQSTLPASERILLVASLLWFSVLAGAQTQPEFYHPPICPPPCLTVSASPDPAFAGATVTLTATFAGALGGYVNFWDGGKPLGGSPRIGNVARLNTLFNAGFHHISAQTGSIAIGVYRAGGAESIKPNIGLYRPVWSTFIVDYDHSGTADAYVSFGAPGGIGLVGDVLGNKTDAFVLYRNGTWYVDANHDGTVDVVYGFGGLPGDIPLLADMDGDGKADLVIYRAGTWYVSTNRDGVANEVYHFGGAPEDIPLIADMKGDGFNDLIIYRNGMWYVSYARDGAVDATFAFGGLPQDKPFAFNWNSVDNVADPIIFRDGFWFVGSHAVRDGTRQAKFGFGAAGDIPLLGTFR